MLARAHAARHGAAVGLRFERQEESYRVAMFLDGNGNGMRQADINRGADPRLTPWWTMADLFPGVRIALGPSIRPVDSTQLAGAGVDAVRFGRSDTITLTPIGTATGSTPCVCWGHRADAPVVVRSDERHVASELTQAVETDRRLTRRRGADEIRWLKVTRVRPGRVATLINWSSEGLLIETTTRLVPETIVVVQLIGERKRIVASGRVLRSSVASISGMAGMRYHGAVRFDHPIDFSDSSA